MMNERSTATDPAGTRINLAGGSVVAPQWDNAKNVAFTYPLTVGPIENEKQIVQLYLKPQAGEDRREFVAFEYIYTRQH